MSAIKAFRLVSSILGVNFLHKRTAIVLQMILLAYSFYQTFIWRFLIGDFPKNFVYVVSDFFQIELFFCLQFLIVLRAFVLRNYQAVILSSIDRYFIEFQENESEKKFLLNIFIIFFVRIVKYVVGDWVTKMYATKQALPEIVLVASDLMFQYYINKLTFFLENISLKLSKGRSLTFYREESVEILEIFWIKRAIKKRYNFEMFLTITYNILQLSFSFYMVCMRIKFNLLDTFGGKIMIKNCSI